jgi:hypothetical protein
MRWIGSRWPTELLLPVLVAALQAAVAAPLLHLLGAGAFAIHPGEIPWPPALAIVGLAAFWSTHLLAGRGLSLTPARALSLLLWIATTAIWLVWQYGAERDALIRRAPLFAAVLAFLAWWRGVGVGSDPEPFRPAALRRLTQLAWLTLTVELVIAALGNGAAAEDALASGRVAAPVAIISGLLAVAAGEIEQARLTAIRRGGRAPGRGTWLTFAGGATFAIVIVALLIGGLIGQDVWNILAWPIVNGLWLLSQALLYTLIAIAFLFFLVIYPLFWLVRYLLNGGEPPKRPEAMPAPTNFNQFADRAQHGASPAVLDALRIGLVAIVIIVCAIVLLRAIRRYRGIELDEEADEQRESLWSRDLARAQLRGLFSRKRAAYATPKLDFTKEPASVREAFQLLTALAEREEIGRLPTESATDFAARLEGTWPDAATSVVDLTERYLRVRYGEQPDAPDIPGARSAWRAIWQRRSRESS